MWVYLFIIGSEILPTIVDVESDPRSESYILVLSMLLVDRQG
jgi:hypothetical protein